MFSCPSQMQGKALRRAHCDEQINHCTSGLARQLSLLPSPTFLRAATERVLRQHLGFLPTYKLCICSANTQGWIKSCHPLTLQELWRESNNVSHSSEWQHRGCGFLSIRGRMDATHTFFVTFLWIREAAKARDGGRDQPTESQVRTQASLAQSSWVTLDLAISFVSSGCWRNNRSL